MCHLVYTNFQRQSAVINMTVAEVLAAKVHKEYHDVVSVWEHKTTNAHGAAKIAVNARGYSLLIRYTGEREGSDLIRYTGEREGSGLVFLTKSGDKLTHIGYEYEQLSYLIISPLHQS